MLCVYVNQAKELTAAVDVCVCACVYVHAESAEGGPICLYYTLFPGPVNVRS